MVEQLYQVQVEDIFEGPMDLLVHLIKKNELDIYDIPIALITEQYLQYVDWMKAMNVEFAGDFIVMASTLAQIKSRMLLPVHDGDEEEDEDPRLGLTRPLLEYLGEHATRPEFTCRFRWRKGSVAIWDNRCTQHNAISDYDGERREMHRVTIIGERPYQAADGDAPRASAAA